MANDSIKKVNNLNNIMLAVYVAKYLISWGYSVINIHNLEKELNEENAAIQKTQNLIAALQDYIITVETASLELAKDIANKYPDKKKYKCYISVNYKHDPQEKCDISVQMDNEHIEKISVKLYKKNSTLSSKVQVCSGTFISTMISIGFDQNGVGSYLNGNDEINIMGKGVDLKIAKEHIEKKFGLRSGYLFSQAKGLDKHFIPLITGPNTDYDDVKWKAACKKVGEEGVPIMLEYFNILIEKDEYNVIKRVLNKIGNDNTQIVICLGSGYYSSFRTNKFHVLLNLWKENKLKISVCQSGKKHNRRGICINIYNKYTNEILLSINMPLTINKNGAWQLTNKEGRYCKTDGAFIAFGKLRPIKSKQMATSTNCYVSPTQII